MSDNFLGAAVIIFNDYRSPALIRLDAGLKAGSTQPPEELKVL